MTAPDDYCGNADYQAPEDYEQEEESYRNRYMMCDICGIHQRVVKTTTTQNHDPTEVYHLECGHKVI